MESQIIINYLSFWEFNDFSWVKAFRNTATAYYAPIAKYCKTTENNRINELYGNLCFEIKP